MSTGKTGGELVMERHRSAAEVTVRFSDARTAEAGAEIRAIEKTGCVCLPFVAVFSVSPRSRGAF